MRVAGTSAIGLPGGPVVTGGSHFGGRPQNWYPGGGERRHFAFKTSAGGLVPVTLLEFLVTAARTRVVKADRRVGISNRLRSARRMMMMTDRVTAAVGLDSDPAAARDLAGVAG